MSLMGRSHVSKLALAGVAADDQALHEGLQEHGVDS
jgi:hypothetical protein